MTTASDTPPSPCISLCRMDPERGSVAERAAGGLCIGCLRTIDEIVEWGMASDRRKHEVLDAIASRRASSSTEA